jgi:hypothetical protein
LAGNRINSHLFLPGLILQTFDIEFYIGKSGNEFFVNPLKNSANTAVPVRVTVTHAYDDFSCISRTTGKNHRNCCNNKH